MSSTHTEPSRAGFVLLLAGLAMFGPFSIDTVFPMFPQMQSALHIGPVQMQQTISVYLLAYALMSLLHGPLSDALGRRSVVMAGVAVFVLASIGCALSTSIWQLLFFRALQGVSAGSGLIVGRAIIRDRFHGPEAQRVMSRITMVFGVAPAIAPIIGGIIGTRFGWEAIFWFLAVFALVLLATCWRWLPETHPKEARLPLEPIPLFSRYLDMLRNPRFVWLCLSGSFNFSALFIYIASAPAFVLTHLKLGATDFGYFFVPAIMGMMTGAYLSGRRAGRHTPESNVKLAYAVMLLAGVGNVVYCLLAPAVAWPWAVIPIMINGAGISLAFPTLTLLVLDIYPQERGTASSLQAFIQLTFSAIVAGAISPWLSLRPSGLAMGAVAASLLGLVAWKLAQRAGVKSSPEMMAG
ncbi:multidrug effflux MFS transporter [Chitinimonas viridis]|uniref:Bcr/CflA family efflux transporter n=1 Tax=Chitinimonas viridis TaxID=664880 RepID=A0ABT8B4P4_9NEIS|nr:multidrug effflux MFS transporter [Chitinimonas viridis]MDN3577217.1 multidrug effflux MFS transporter [Chitinimonas viridis]